MLALNSGHTASDVTAPDLVRLLYSKLTGQVIRDVWSFNRCLHACRRTRLLAGQPQPTHQTEYLKASDVHTVFLVRVRLPAELRLLMNSRLTWALRANRSASMVLRRWRTRVNDGI